MKILAVEDEPEYLEMLSEVVSSLGHSLAVAGNGLEALTMAEKEKMDLVVADVRMPVMDGIEFHERLREQPGYATTPFIFLTGIGEIGKVREACTTASDMVLQKPVPIEKLLQLFSGKNPF
jgi:CheY-like chemotaxis protein